MAAAPVLEFERPIAELEKQIEELKRLAADQSIDVTREIAPLEQKLGAVRVQISQTLTPLQRVQVARMSRRPFTSDYLRHA
ncbi:MAG: acetyl-CoA carboxylase carboxyl transferase subunit alpha, partial [Gemmatimonas sp.]